MHSRDTRRSLPRSSRGRYFTTSGTDHAALEVPRYQVVLAGDFHFISPNPQAVLSLPLPPSTQTSNTPQPNQTNAAQKKKRRNRGHKGVRKKKKKIKKKKIYTHARRTCTDNEATSDTPSQIWPPCSLAQTPHTQPTYVTVRRSLHMSYGGRGISLAVCSTPVPCLLFIRHFLRF